MHKRPRRRRVRRATVFGENPEALLASQSDFKKSSPREAQERVHTPSGINLVIRHFGCAHYALDFEFTWPDPQMPPPPVALKGAASLLEKLPFKVEYQQVMRSLVASLRKMAEDPYKQPLTMSDTETLTATTPAMNMLQVRYDVAL